MEENAPLIFYNEEEAETFTAPVPYYTDKGAENIGNKKGSVCFKLF
jgi:hypothetical protein